jgi:hypothetical protein
VKDFARTAGNAEADGAASHKFVSSELITHSPQPHHLRLIDARSEVLMQRHDVAEHLSISTWQRIPESKVWCKELHGLAENLRTFGVQHG